MGTVLWLEDRRLRQAPVVVQLAPVPESLPLSAICGIAEEGTDDCGGERRCGVAILGADRTGGLAFSRDQALALADLLRSLVAEIDDGGPRVG